MELYRKEALKQKRYLKDLLQDRDSGLSQS